MTFLFISYLFACGSKEDIDVSVGPTGSDTAESSTEQNSQEPSSSSAPEEVPTPNPFQDREPPLTYGQSTRVKDRLNALYGKHPQGEAYRLDVGRQQTDRP